MFWSIPETEKELEALRDRMSDFTLAKVGLDLLTALTCLWTGLAMPWAAGSLAQTNWQCPEAPAESGVVAVTAICMCPRCARQQPIHDGVVPCVFFDTASVSHQRAS